MKKGNKKEKKIKPQETKEHSTDLIGNIRTNENTSWSTLREKKTIHHGVSH